MSDRILTDEVRELLLGDMPFSASSTIDFTPKQYLKKGADGKLLLPEEFIPVFKVRGFTEKQKNESKRCIKNVEESADQIQDLTRMCIDGWSGMYELGSREELVYKEDVNKGVDKELYKRIPEAILTDVFLYICKISGLLDTTLLGLSS